MGVKLGQRGAIAGREQPGDEFIAEPHKAVWWLAVPVMFGNGRSDGLRFYGHDLCRDGNDAVAALMFNMPLGPFIGITFGLGVEP